MSYKKKSQSTESRRKFLKTGIAGSIAAVTLPSLSFAGQELRKFMSSPATSPFELDEITIDELSSGFKSGKYTVRSVAEKYIKRINEIDKAGPAINSVIQINPDALKIADALDKELKEKGPRSPMHGIPVLIKDNIDTRIIWKPLPDLLLCLMPNRQKILLW